MAKTVCCIGDIHGHITKLQNLWSNLEKEIDPLLFQSAIIIFLGDYCDRGPNTSQVIDFLIQLPSRYPNQKHVFLSGNHEFCFAAFLGLLPLPSDGSKFSCTWKEFEASENSEELYKGDGYENMHLQGRIWAGSAKGIEFMGSTYDAAPTFESYGVPHGSSGMLPVLPPFHGFQFLAGL